jgi:hypothetical protein
MAAPDTSATTAQNCMERMGEPVLTSVPVVTALAVPPPWVVVATVAPEVVEVLDSVPVVDPTGVVVVVVVVAAATVVVVDEEVVVAPVSTAAAVVVVVVAPTVVVVVEASAVEVVVGGSVLVVEVVVGSVTGGRVIGGIVIGGIVIGGIVIGAMVMGGTVMGGTVIGGTVIGGTVIGGTVIGGTVMGGTVVDVEVVDDEVVGARVVDDEVVDEVVVAVGAQTGLVTVFESNVTEPLRAISRPWTVAFVLAVIDVNASTVPTKVEPTPSVAELPTCQKTLQGWPPLMTITLLFTAVMRVDPAWKIHTAPGSPWASRVRVPVIAKAVAL